MTLRFRNIDVTPDDPVEKWGVEGLLAAIERGDLPDWRRVARAVQRDPEGAVALDLAQALEIAEPSGARSLLALALERAREPETEAVARRVREAIARSGMTAAEFAGVIGTSPSRLSTYATGRVTPSATMMARMRRAARPRVL